MEIYNTWDPALMIERADYRKLKWVSWSRDIAANENSNLPIKIGDEAHFLSYYLGGEYTTLTAADTDGGANGISIKITDNGKSYPIFDNLIPVSIFLSPGRQRASGVAGDPSNPLFTPIEFYHPFTAGTSINVEFASSLPYANRLTLVWYGEWISKNPMPDHLR